MSRTLETMQACLLCALDEGLSQLVHNAEHPLLSISGSQGNDIPTVILEALYHYRLCDGKDVSPENALAYLVNSVLHTASGQKTASINVPCSTTEAIGALESIFNHLNGEHYQAFLSAEWQSPEMQYPSNDIPQGTSPYEYALKRWNEALCGELFDDMFANGLIELAERCFQYVPSVADAEGRQDVSLFHHCKAMAAIGCCLERWLTTNGISDYKHALPLNDSIRPMVLFSIDLSGIQTFIYTIANKGSLKGLRARSFYLSMIMDHIADMILEECGLYRINLIYAGGGKAHLLLPNDGFCVERAERIVQLSNSFLQRQFGTALFLASGYAETSASELSSTSPSGRSLSDIFRAASMMISHRKLQRYDAGEWIFLNNRGENSDDRECAICGNSRHLVPHGGNEWICATCDSLESFSNSLTKDDLFLAVDRNEQENSLPLPGGFWLVNTGITALNSASLPGTVTRVYHVNGEENTSPLTVSIRIGNYQARDLDGTSLTFEQLANGAVGIKRLGVLRADVDNLGALFARGFLAPGEPNPHRFETLPRYMALSSAITVFFQKEINRAVIQTAIPWYPGASGTNDHKVSIVYSGGDDVFLVGAWNEILDAGLALHDAFVRYTGGCITLSAGFGMFNAHEPIGIMADFTAELEEEAKQIGDNRKDAIALFSGAASEDAKISFCFHWSDLRERVLEDKIPLVRRLLTLSDRTESDAGNAFLYQVLALLRDVNRGPIAIARLAYLLARHAPDKRTQPEAQTKEYDAISHRVYQWALNPEDNRALQTAIILYVYANRKESNNNV